MKTYRIKKIFEGHKWNQRNVYKSYSDNPLSYKLCKNSIKYFNGQINGSFHLNKSLFEHENNLTSLASISFVARFNRYCAQRKPWRSSNTKMSKIRFHQFPFVSPNVMLPTLFFSLTYWNFSGISYEERSTYILKLRVTHVRKKYLFLAVNISVSVLWKVLIKEVSGEGLEGGVNQTEWTLSQTFQNAVSDIPALVFTKILQKYSLQAMHINGFNSLIQRYIVKLWNQPSKRVLRHWFVLLYWPDQQNDDCDQWQRDRK